MIKAAVSKTKEMIIDQIIDLLGQGIIHLLQEVMTGSVPPFGRPLYKSLRDDVQRMTRKFPRSCPVKARVPVRGQHSSGGGTSHPSAISITWFIHIASSSSPMICGSSQEGRNEGCL